MGKKKEKKGHEHSHAHSHGVNIEYLNKAFILGIVLNIVYVVVEMGAGFMFDSMALVSDAGHNLSDVISLILALMAFKLMQVKPNSKFTYGYKKSTVLVSLLNACILLAVVAVIVVESIHKINNPQPVEGGIIAWVAGVGIVVNAFTAWLFMKDRKKDLNVQGAFLHMVADALVSVGVVISGLIITFTGWYIIDPIISIVVAAVILISTAKLFTDSLRLSLDGVPSGITPEKVREHIMEHEPAVEDIHHIHIWALSTTENAMTAHIVMSPSMEESEKDIRKRIKEHLYGMKISHVTLEFEHSGEHCDDNGCGASRCME